MLHLALLDSHLTNVFMFFKNCSLPFIGPYSVIKRFVFTYIWRISFILMSVLPFVSACRLEAATDLSSEIIIF